MQVLVHLEVKEHLEILNLVMRDSYLYRIPIERLLPRRWKRHCNNTICGENSNQK